MKDFFSGHSIALDIAGIKPTELSAQLNNAGGLESVCFLLEDTRIYTPQTESPHDSVSLHTILLNKLIEQERDKSDTSQACASNTKACIEALDKLMIAHEPIITHINNITLQELGGSTRRI